MRLRGKGINPEALVECACYLVFGILLFRMTYTGTYLSYVTPRMKPYLYGLSVLMILWAAMNGKKLFQPKYKSRLHHCLVLIVPILILAVPPAPPAAGSMIKNYSNVNIPLAPSGSAQTGGASEGAQASASSDSSQSSDSYEEYGWDGSLEKPDTSADGSLEVPDTYSDGNQGTQDDSSDGSGGQQPQGDASADNGLNGLDEAARTITIADDDFYAWMNELGGNAEKYQGYTITMKGLVFLDLDGRKENEFALVRLSMWCCSADMSPIGLIVSHDGSLLFKENDWVTVTGTVQAVDGYPSIKADKIEAAEKPEQEYIYPYY